MQVALVITNSGPRQHKINNFRGQLLCHFWNKVVNAEPALTRSNTELSIAAAAFLGLKNKLQVMISICY